MIYIKIFDTHCDTAYVMQKLGVPFENDRTHLSLNGIKKYERYEQMFAIWSSNKRTAEENWEHYKTVKEYFDKEILPYKSENFFPHLAIEGCDLLNGNLSRIDTLKADGVKMMTLVWADECCMGGAHNTNKGLTPFGKDAVRKMCENNIIPDISHASDKMSYETFELAEANKLSVCASHSDSRTLRDHTRNMTDDMFSCIKSLGGLVGINFCCNFLEDAEVKQADITSILRHTEHFLSLGGENTVCLGSDFDGIKTLPTGIDGVQSLDTLYDEFKKINYSDELLEKIFYTNAKTFFDKW